MQAIRRKLNSRKGASMLMALLLMLVGIMVSAVIGSAATSAVANKRSEKEQQQAYLAVSSAAELVRDDFVSNTGKYSVITTQYYYSQYDTRPFNTKTVTQEPTCAMKSIITEIVKWFNDYGASAFHQVYTISADGYEDITADFTATLQTNAGDENIYALTVTFTNGADSEHPCRMVLTMDGQESVTESESAEGSYYTRVSTKTFAWSKASLQKEVQQTK